MPQSTYSCNGKGWKPYWLKVFSLTSVQLLEVKSLSRAQLFATPWTIAYQAPPSMGFSRQQYWSGLPFPSPGDLPDPGIEPGSPGFQADTLTSEPPGKSLNCTTHSWIVALLRWRGLSNSMSYAVQGHLSRWDMVGSSDKMWSTVKENGKLLQYSCLRNPMNIMNNV